MIWKEHCIISKHCLDFMVHYLSSASKSDGWHRELSMSYLNTLACASLSLKCAFLESPTTGKSWNCHILLNALHWFRKGKPSLALIGNWSLGFNAKSWYSEGRRYHVIICNKLLVSQCWKEHRWRKERWKMWGHLTLVTFGKSWMLLPLTRRC